MLLALLLQSAALSPRASVVLRTVTVPVLSGVSELPQLERGPRWTLLEAGPDGALATGTFAGLHC